VALSALQLPSGGDVLVSGFRTVLGVSRASISKVSLTTGVELWTALFNDGVAGVDRNRWLSTPATSGLCRPENRLHPHSLALDPCHVWVVPP